MGYTILRPEDQEFRPPSWRPDERVRRIVELPLHASAPARASPRRGALTA